MINRKAVWAYITLSALFIVVLLIRVTYLQMKIVRINDVVGGMYYESYATSIEASKYAKSQSPLRLLERHLKIIELARNTGVPPEHAVGIQEIATLARIYCMLDKFGTDSQKFRAKDALFDGFSSLSENEFVLVIQSQISDVQSINKWVSERDSEYEE